MNSEKLTQLVVDALDDIKAQAQQIENMLNVSRQRLEIGVGDDQAEMVEPTVDHGAVVRSAVGIAAASAGSPTRVPVPCASTKARSAGSTPSSLAAFSIRRSMT